MAQMNISLPEGLKTWVDGVVARGRYSGASDYIRDLIRRDQERTDETAWVQSMIDQGLDSPTLEADALEIIDEVIAAGLPKA